MIVIANGMGMLLINPLWVVAFLVATLMAITGLLLAMCLRRGKTKIISVIALCVSLAPVGVVVFCFDYIYHYAEYELLFFMPGSIVPLVISGIAMWLSARPRETPEHSNQKQ